MKLGTILLARKCAEPTVTEHMTYVPTQILSAPYAGEHIETPWTANQLPNGAAYTIEIVKSRRGNIRGRLLSLEQPRPLQQRATQACEVIKLVECGLESRFPEITDEDIFRIDDFEGTGTAVYHNGKVLRVSSRLKIAPHIDFIRRKQKSGFTVSVTPSHYDLVHAALAHHYQTHGVPVVSLLRSTQLYKNGGVH